MNHFPDSIPLPPPALIPGHFDICPMVIFRHRGDISHRGLVPELEFLAGRRARGVASLEDALGVRGLRVGKGGMLESAEAALIQPSISGRRANGRR